MLLSLFLALAQAPIRPLSLQEAVWRAPEGAVLYADAYRPDVKHALIVTGKSLTIVGGTFAPLAPYTPALILGGDGDETIEFFGAQVVLDARGPSSACIDVNGPALVRFDDCTITADCQAAGLWSWRQTTIAMERTTLTHAPWPARPDACTPNEWAPVGIYSPGAVTLGFSSIEGGHAPEIGFPATCWGEPSCGGRGGTALVSGRVRRLERVELLGGRGALWPGVPCSGPNGLQLELLPGRIVRGR